MFQSIYELIKSRIIPVDSSTSESQNQQLSLSNLNLEYRMNMPVLEHKDLNLNSQTSLPDCDPHQQTSLASANHSRLQEFIINVELSKEKIVQLVNSDQYSQEAQQLNQKAVQLATQGYIEEAGVLLGEAEKLLEYAANSGKQINRSLIITVLHNEAFCHQQGWNLERCANYIEALIYNLNCEIKQEEKFRIDEQAMMENIVLRDKIIHYYLLFCAINSQLKLNDGALIAAKRAHSMIQLNSQMLQQIAEKSRIDLELRTIMLLNELSNFECRSEQVQIERMTQAVSCFYHIWRNKCKFPQHQLKGLSERYLSFSIGNIMQMEPSPYTEDFTCGLNLSYEFILERVVNLSISYFTMATELRILAVRTAGGKQAAKEVRQYRESQCYHLTAIILVLYYFPFKMLYLEHILTSYQNHYDINIEDLDPYIDLNMTPQQLFYNLLIKGNKDVDQIKSSTAGNSQKGSSGRSSHMNVRQSCLNKLEEYVRASLKKQNYQQVKDMAKLNNYYYMKGQFGQSKEKAISKRSYKYSKNNKHSKSKGFLTSKNSAQKTPKGFVSNQISPKKIKASSKNSKATSKRGSINHTIVGQKKVNVIDEYFRTEENVPPFKERSKSKRKQIISKENKECVPQLRFRQTASPRNSAWKAANLTNRHMNSKRKSKDSELKGLKSTSRAKGKLHEVKSKQKVVYYK